MTAAMLLYTDLRAPNPRRVRIFLAEKGVAYDTIEVSIAAADHQKPEFRKKNPLALLPVLELGDGKILRESMAICRYLEEQYPEPNLLGATSVDSPYWPGCVLFIEDDKPPALRRLLTEVSRSDLGGREAYS